MEELKNSANFFVRLQKLQNPKSVNYGSITNCIPRTEDFDVDFIHSIIILTKNKSCVHFFSSSNDGAINF